MTANYILLSEHPGAEPPIWPHFLCDGGYAWASSERKRRCFRGVAMYAPTVTMATILNSDANAIERVWAFRLLYGGDPRDKLPQRWPAIRNALFPSACIGCGEKHGPEAGQWTRAAMSIHPDALESLRRANPPLRLLLDVDVPEQRRRVPRNERRCSPGLPIRESDEKTLLAQLAWACDLEARRAEESEWQNESR